MNSVLYSEWGWWVEKELDEGLPTELGLQLDPVCRATLSDDEWCLA